MILDLYLYLLSILPPLHKFQNFFSPLLLFFIKLFIRFGSKEGLITDKSSDIGLSNITGFIFSEYILKSFIDKKENVTDSYKPLFARVSEAILFLYSSKLNILFFNE